MRGELKRLLLGALIITVLSLSFTDTTKAQNGSLYLSPSAGQIIVGRSFSLALRVNTGGVAVNAAEGAVVFDAQKLSVTSVSKSGSIFSIWAEEPKFSNAEGTIDFSGGVPTPGYSGSNGLVLTINFKAKTATTVRGYTEIILVSGAILANDGEGTNILVSLGKATYFIGAAVAEPTPAPEFPEVPVSGQAMTITSPTHTDQSKWYSNKNPVFKWDLPSEVREVALVLSKRVKSPPIISYTPPISEKVLTDLEDGVWYLNGRFRTASGLGPVTSFKFNVDTQPPNQLSIFRIDTDDPTNPRPELVFETSDATSGIDRYEMKVGEGEWIKVEPGLADKAYAMPVQKFGKYVVEIKAFDKAENSTSAKLDIEIAPIKAPIITWITKEAGEEKPITIRGTTEPRRKIIIETTRKLDKDYLIYETAADENGDWSTEITDLLVGKYKVAARAQDERQAISELSNTVDTQVKGGWLNFIFNIFDQIVNILSGKGLFIAFIIALVGLILVFIELIKVRAGKWLKKAGNRLIVKMAREKSAKKLAHIIKDMQDELKFLDQIAKRRSLSTEEKYLKNKISSYIKMLKYIDKEID